MKLIVFSDIHGNILALDAFLEKIKETVYDYLVFCGDIFGYYYGQNEIIERLSRLDQLIWLKGNHDEYFLRLYYGESEEAEYIEKYGHSYENLRERFQKEKAERIACLKPEHIMECGGRRIGIFHGTPEDSLEGRLYPDRPILNPDGYCRYDIVILGHTHCRMLREERNTLVINSGSLGQPRDGNGFGYAVLDTKSLQAEFYEVKIDRTQLYRQIDRYDPNLKKLKEVLERRKA